MALFKNDKLMTGAGPTRYYILLEKLLLKTTSGLQNASVYLFWLKKLKNNMEIFLKPTGIELWSNPIKIYNAVKKKDVVIKLSKLFYNHTFKYYKFKLVEKWAQFLFRFSQNLQLKSDNFSEPILLNYCSLILQYMKFLFEKTFFVFDRFSNKIILKYRLTFV